jgi:hypothetical protein
MKMAPLLLAIEFSEPTRCHTYFDRALTQSLANQFAFELAKHLPSVERLGLAWMAGCFDQAQILRPGFPVHQALLDLYQAGIQADSGPQVLSLHALRGQAPAPALQVDVQLLGGPMVLIPLAVIGPDALVQAAAELLENKLLDTGLTDARTALFLNQALGAEAVHARLMTLDDLAAMCAMQLKHVGFEEVWACLESVLYHVPETGAAHTLCRARSRAQGQQVELLLAALPEVCFHVTSGPNSDEASEPASDAALASFGERKLRERQALSLLEAHAVPVSYLPQCAIFELAPDASYWLQWRSPESAKVATLEPVHSAELGVMCYRLLAAEGNVLGAAYPLQHHFQASLRARFQLL